MNFDFNNTFFYVQYNTGLGSKKYFRLDFIGFDEGTKNLQFDVMLLESVIVGDHDIGSIPSAQGQGVLNIFSYCFKVEQPPSKYI